MKMEVTSNSAVGIYDLGAIAPADSVAPASEGFEVMAPPCNGTLYHLNSKTFSYEICGQDRRLKDFGLQVSIH